MDDSACVVCRHRPAGRGQVCEPDFDRIVEQLGDLPRKMAALTLQLVPAQAGALQPRVSTSRGGSPAGARLDALTLTGPGSDGLSPESVAGMVSPLVRRWRTVETVEVTVVVAGAARTVTRDVTLWHREAAVNADGSPVTAVADDQVGLLPPAEWLDSWVRAWRRHFGHHTPLPRPARRPAATLGRETLLWYAAQSGTAQAVAALAAVARAWRARNAAVVTGMHPGAAGTLTAAARPDDPLADEWEARWGAPPPPVAPNIAVGYLLTWLPRACEDDVGIAGMAAELRALTAELVRVLGERPDVQWLGRCPAQLTGPDAPARPCGAGLWQDPHASQIMCPRCRSTWGPRRIEVLHLADQIRRVWPIDRRRRYNRADLGQLAATPPKLVCAGCGGPATVAWHDVTATDDVERWWRPARTACPAGCRDPGRLP